MNAVEALQRGFSLQFLEGEDSQEVANGIWAEKTVEPLLWAVHFHTRIDDIEALNLMLATQFESITKDGSLWKVLRIMTKKFFDKKELPGAHGENRYRVCYKFPEEGPVESLIALQFIPPGVGSNGSHRHLEQGRIEDIFLLHGGLQVNFHNPLNLDEITFQRILNPFEGIVIDPRRYHSVANIGKTMSIALILGTQTT